MSRRYRKLTGSSRSRFYREPARRARYNVKRSQRVRFRRRYASSLLRKSAAAFWLTARLAFAVAVFAWAASFAARSWQSAAWLQVRSVEYADGLPQRLPETLALSPGRNIFSVKPGRLEKRALERFPELADVDIDRRLDRRVVVSARYRTPIALLERHGKTMGVDASGGVFPLPGDAPVTGLPELRPAAAAHLSDLVAFLDGGRRSAADFFDDVAFLQTDNMRTLSVELRDGVSIRWGRLDRRTAGAKADRVLRLRRAFAPAKTPASLRFITDDRIVIDKNWARVEPNTSEGAKLVQTGNLGGR